MSKTNSLRLLALFIVLNLYGCVGFLLTTIAAGGAIAIISDSRDLQTSNEDQCIRHQIYLKIKEDPDFADSNITVSSFHKIVLLTGQTPKSVLKVKAEKIAKTLKQIDRVYNEITIGKSIPIKSQSKDVWITTKVKSAIVATPGMKSGSVKVITENRVVYLMGIVTTKQAKEIVELARKVSGVTKVVKAFKYFVIKDEHQLNKQTKKNN